MPFMGGGTINEHAELPQITAGTAEDFLIARAGVVTEIAEIDEWTARKVTYGLYELRARGVNPITLIINSDGGSVFEAHGMYDTIRHLQSMGTTVVGRVHGHAMSAAVFVLQACEERVMTESGLLMVHGLKEFRVGDIRDLEADRDAMEKTLDIQCDMLGRTRMSAKEWREILRDHHPHYYRAKEALALGLVDRVE